MSHFERLLAMLAQDNWVVLDTETTGLDRGAEIVQIAVIDSQGQTLVDTLLKPTKPIPTDATNIHGITNRHVATAPTMADMKVQQEIISAIRGRDVVIYNADFDLRMLYQTSQAHCFPIDWQQVANTWSCAMLAYAEYHGQWNYRYSSYKWQKLSLACQQQGIPVVNAHSALADCQMTWQLIRTLAARASERF